MKHLDVVRRTTRTTSSDLGVPMHQGTKRHRIPEIVEAMGGIVCDVTNKARLDQMALARYTIDPSFGIDGARGTDTVPGLVLRGDGNSLHRGKENIIETTKSCERIEGGTIILFASAVLELLFL